ncbi:unnamed protein product [Cylindrotheca closterium]|uniref:Uncharacterized protein n=1 Tax=Cylindrotheca closterium TaxID=2856 RepID=A0AAD2G934_9STRA|nr:unnamed protein product [Cylindrotheca closterium]
MFSLVNGVYDNYLAPVQINLLIVGPAGVGKTALLERLKVTQFPKRPRKQPSLSLAPLPPILEESFVPEDDDEEEVYEAVGKMETTTTSTEASTAADDKEAKDLTAQLPRMNSVTSSSSLSKTTPHKNSRRRSNSHSFSPTPAIVVTQAQRRGLARLICPAPKRYHDTKGDEDEEFVPYDNNSITSHADDEHSTSQNSSNNEAPKGRQRTHSKEFNVDEALDINGGDASPPSAKTKTATNGIAPKRTSISNIPQTVGSRAAAAPRMTQDAVKAALLQANDKEVDRKYNSKMLSLDKIRPTIGTNLGKINMYGVQVNLFDVGGTMHDLWDKYYDDCDGVVYCWKLGGDDSGDHKEEGEDTKEPLDAAKQQEVLEQVRKAIPDDVPFLVLGHIFGNANVRLTDKIYGTNYLLPHYHNPMTGLCCGSAKTGVGIQSAMEWLIPLSKRQQKERLSRKSSSSSSSSLPKKP